MARVGFDTWDQSSFSLGAVQSVARNLLPPQGVYELLDGALTQDGAIYQRGGSVSLSNADFGTTGLTTLWSGYLGSLQRTFFATSSAFGALNGNTPVNLGGSGLAAPARAVEIDGLLFVGGGSGVIYGGSLKGADWSTGTVAVTAGSKTVTGTGTSWLANVDAGMLFKRGSERYYSVASVNSDTSITLNQAYQGATGTGISYGLTRLGATSSSTFKTAPYYCVVANKLVALNGNRIDVSNGPAVSDGHLQPDVFSSLAYLLLPEGNQIVGGQSIGQTLLVFTTGGIFRVSGLALDETDAAGNVQWRMDQLSRDLICWSDASIATWNNALVVAAVNGVYLVDGVSAPRLVSRSITPRLQSYVAAGHHTGIAEVFNSHYLISVLDSNQTVVDTLVCRLDRPIETPYGELFPWSFMQGSGANVTAFATSVGATTRQPLLLGAGRQSSGRVLDLTGWFSPSAANKLDHDGTWPQLDITFGDIQTGSGLKNSNTVVHFRLHYELVDGASDAPTISAFSSTATVPEGVPLWGSMVWGSFVWTDSIFGEFVLESGQAPVNDGGAPYTWRVIKNTRYYRPRIQSVGPSASLVIRGIELDIRTKGG